MENFQDFFNNNYQPLTGISLGRPVYKSVNNNLCVNIPVSSLTKHGLVTGSTGTGKSRVIQLLIEGLCTAKIPVLLSDLKGDMSGFARAGVLDKIANRAKELDFPVTPQSFPTNYWGNAKGLINFRSRVDSIDFVIMAKLLTLNNTQESHLGMIYHYANKHQISIITLQNLLDITEFIIKHPKEQIGVSPTSLTVIERKLINLITGNLNGFFGSPEIQTDDLLRDINVLWLQNFQKIRFDSGSLMAIVLYHLYQKLPEVGGVDKPKMVIVVDEAHQLFTNANQSLVALIVTILKQIRSKGVGIIFNTQNAEDIPEKILEQLGFKIQFALRSYSTQELADIRGAVNSFPASEYYVMKEEVKSLESGTAFISVLNHNGALLPPVKTKIFPPSSFMDAIQPDDLGKINNQILINKYQQPDTDHKLDLNQPLDGIRLPDSGGWHVKKHFELQIERKLKRQTNAKNREIKKILIIIAVILALIALIYFFYIINSVITIR